MDTIEPILYDNCYDCHGDGRNKGNVSFDEFDSIAELAADRELWDKVLRNVRSGIMPPKDEPRPSEDEIAELRNWIVSDSFEIDPNNPDPGRVTVRRLNRIEYSNTILELMGIEFEGEAEFPPDDSSHGFDNIGKALSMSPLLLEKYLAAADVIVNQSVPKVARTMQKQVLHSDDFSNADGSQNGWDMSFYDPETVTKKFTTEISGEYFVNFDLEVRGSFVYDPGASRIVLTANGQEMTDTELVWHNRKEFKIGFKATFDAGEHELGLQLIPLKERTAAAAEETRPWMVGHINLRINKTAIEGPAAEEHWTLPENYTRFFPDGPPENTPESKEQFARKALETFTAKAFRRPADKQTIDRLFTIASSLYESPEHTFEEGVARAFTAALVSPRFLFRLEGNETPDTEGRYPLIDEYALASRLSYFLWSSMPDQELFDLAKRGELRRNLPQQLDRMLSDKRSKQFVRNFVGQWLQVRDIEHVPINGRAVLGLPERKPGEPRYSLELDLRADMRRETEMLFEHILSENRSSLELIDSNYTFLSERLAKHYGIEGVEGEDMRLVTLSADSHRGGVLTHGSILAVTSNPTRTSPVKRGLFILDNLLGAPPPPPPPDIPALEASAKDVEGHEPQLREILEMHRKEPLCYSCHQRLDPLGLALENFNALATWRDVENERPIDVSGELITGESFSTFAEMRRILATDRKTDFYRCLTEKLLTYALGRGIDTYDIYTVDNIVEQMESNNGQLSTLVSSIVNSVPFQRSRYPTIKDNLSQL